MEFFLEKPTKYSLLLVSDIDRHSASKLTEHFIPRDPLFDAVLIAGPFLHTQPSSAEEKAVATGDMAGIIASCENICCRVAYLATELDPVESLTEQLHLTPNSVNIHARRLNLADSLYLVGFSEKSNSDLTRSKLPDDVDRSPESDDELENVEISSNLSVSIIKQLLSRVAEENSTSLHSNTTTGEIDDTSKPPNSTVESNPMSGILMMNYQYSHTLNQLLFHMSADLSRSGVNLCVISSPNCTETARLPTKFGKMNIAALKSLREGGFYTAVTIEYDPELRLWNKVSIETKCLPSSN